MPQTAVPQSRPPSDTLHQETVLLDPMATKAARSTTMGTKKERTVRPVEKAI